VSGSVGTSSTVPNLGARPLAGVVWQDAGGTVHRFTGEQMTIRVGEIATALSLVGVTAGARVAGLMDRRPATIATAMATARLGATYVPLAGRWGKAVVAARLSGAMVVVVDEAHRALVPAGTTALVIAGAGLVGDPVVNDLRSLGPVPPVARVVTPAALVHPWDADASDGPVAVGHDVVDSLDTFLREVLCAGPTDLVLSTGDPSGGYGLVATGIVPLVCGIPRAMLQEPFSVAGWLGCLAATGATHLVAAAPGLLAVAEAAPPLPPTLRHVVSAGPALLEEHVAWYAARGVAVRQAVGDDEPGRLLLAGQGRPDHADGAKRQRSATRRSLPTSVRGRASTTSTRPGRA
jgi:acetyl-CoA synthetase